MHWKRKRSHLSKKLIPYLLMTASWSENDLQMGMRGDNGWVGWRLYQILELSRIVQTKIFEWLNKSSLNIFSFLFRFGVFFSRFLWLNFTSLNIDIITINPDIDEICIVSKNKNYLYEFKTKFRLKKFFLMIFRLFSIIIYYTWAISFH